MASYVQVRHERTGYVRELKVGWSWTLFLFNFPLGGYVLLMRGVWRWGWFVFALTAVGSLYVYGAALEAATGFARVAGDVAAEATSQAVDISVFLEEREWMGGAPAVFGFFGFVWAVVAIVGGVAGNRATGRELLRGDWVFMNPQGEGALLARRAWRLGGMS